MSKYRPTAVYRLQFNRNLTFEIAKSLVEYFSSLGIEGIYASPLFDAMPGSLHGYDVVSPLTFFKEIGTQKEFDDLCDALKEKGMGLILDLVSNHMSASEHNPWWDDVLAKGEKSSFAEFFDIDFYPPNKKDLKGKVLAPFLESPLHEAYERMSIEKGRLCVDELSLPICEGTEDLPIEQLVDKQHYKLVYWQEAAQNINYRRFFTITGLAALAVERERVFDEYHKFAFTLISQGKVQGVRIDHPDGLYDPKEYFDRLQGAFDHELYVVAEKILQKEEYLPDDWPVAGTVGYDYLNQLTALYIDPEAEKSFDRLYVDFVEEDHDRREMRFSQKKKVALFSLRSEVDALAHRLYVLAKDSGEKMRFKEVELLEALVAVFAAFPVYRTYIGSHDQIINESDKKVITAAFVEAKAREPDFLYAYMFLEKVFSLEDERYLDFILRFQQLTPPVVAKGVEDTYFYTYNRFIALNEVGGDPDKFGSTPEAFHAQNLERLERGPYGLITISTHDTKRSHDVRMRLSVLSEMPRRFRNKVMRWKTGVIDLNTEYFLFQTLVGAWPLKEEVDFSKRIKVYMKKSAREAKVHTNWDDHNVAYEKSLDHFVDTLLCPGSSFLKEFEPFVKEITSYGKMNTLASITMLLGSPGVIDIYQGTELFSFSLVDPDNRRTVDFSLCQKGDEKSSLLKIGLNFRRENPDLIFKGEYIPLEGEAVAFARREGIKVAIFLSGRFFSKNKSFAPTQLPFTFSGKDIFSGREVQRVREVSLEDFPTALFVGQKVR